MSSIKLAGTFLAFILLLMLSMHAYYSGKMERCDQGFDRELFCDKHSMNEDEPQDKTQMKHDILSKVINHCILHVIITYLRGLRGHHISNSYQLIIGKTASYVTILKVRSHHAIHVIDKLA